MLRKVIKKSCIKSFNSENSKILKNKKAVMGAADQQTCVNCSSYMHSSIEGQRVIPENLSSVFKNLH